MIEKIVQIQIHTERNDYFALLESVTRHFSPLDVIPGQDLNFENESKVTPPPL